MTHGVSIARAVRIARKATEATTHKARIDLGGMLQTELPIDVSKAGLAPGRDHDVRVILYEGDTVGKGLEPAPIATDDGAHAIAIPLTVHPRKGQTIACLRIGVRLPGHEDTDVDLVIDRVRKGRLPIILAIIVALATCVALMLGSWGDPTARKGHYEGKTPEEIQRDLDTDVAWYSMEISVASRVAVPEGQTRVELRVENVEANHCDQKVRVWETGHEDDVLYESGAIEPGEYLQFVELAHALPVGTHQLTVQFQGYEQTPTLVSDEGEILGHDTFGASCAAEVTLDVLPASE